MTDKWTAKRTGHPQAAQHGWALHYDATPEWVSADLGITGFTHILPLLMLSEQVSKPEVVAQVIAAMLNAQERAADGGEEPKHSTGTVMDISDHDLLKRALKNTRSKVGKPRWAAVMGVFGLGRGYSQQLCRRFGLDPYEELEA